MLLSLSRSFFFFFFLVCVSSGVQCNKIPVKFFFVVFLSLGTNEMGPCVEVVIQD